MIVRDNQNINDTGGSCIPGYKIDIYFFMKMYFQLLLLLILVASCKPIVTTIYHVNKEVHFNSIEEYKQAAENKYGLNTAHIYYPPESDYQYLVNLIIARKIDYFYGIFPNDSSSFIFSEFLGNNESCLGRILKEIENPDHLVRKDELFKQTSFFNLSTGEPISFKNSGKKKLVLIFAHTQGLLKKKDFLEIQKFVKDKDEYELVIVSIDPVYYYQK